MYQRQVSFGAAISEGLRKYCCFSGRASRSEFWWFMLFYYILAFGASFIGLCFNFSNYMALASNPNTIMSADFASTIMGLYTLPGIVALTLFLPTLGLTFRRLHDTGRSGWWWLIGFVPLIGGIVLLVFTVEPSQMSTNKYGPVPNLVGSY